MLYRQCVLREIDGTGVVTGWIEDRAAKPGVVVSLEDDAAVYRVERVYDFAMDRRTLADFQQRTRNSLPSVVGMG